MSYRFRKFAKRNKALLLAIAAILVAATGISGFLAVQALEAEQGALENEQAALEAEQIALEANELAAQRLVKETAAKDQANEVMALMVNALRSPDPRRDGREITMAEVLDQSVEELESDLEIQPRTRAELLEAIGTTYLGLGLHTDAIPLLEEAVELSTSTVGANHLETLSMMTTLASTYFGLDRNEDSLPLFEEVLEQRTRQLGPDHPSTLKAMHALAVQHTDMDRTDLALPLLEEVLALRTEVLGPEDRDTIQAMDALGVALSKAGRPEDRRDREGSPQDRAR